MTTKPNPTVAAMQAADALSAELPDEAWVTRRAIASALDAFAAAQTAALRAEHEAADHALVDRYRDPTTGWFSFPKDVAKVIRTLEAENAKLLEALKPLAAEAEGWADDDPDDLVMSAEDGLKLTLGDARRAAALLPPTQAEG